MPTRSISSRFADHSLEWLHVLGPVTIFVVSLMFHGCLKPSLADEPRDETYWTKKLAGEMFGVGPGPSSIDVPQVEGSRVDILVPGDPGRAIEVDWAWEKWKEAPGQAILYGVLTNKRPGVVLLVKNRKREAKHILRCALVCSWAKVDFWTYEVDQDAE